MFNKYRTLAAGAALVVLGLLLHNGQLTVMGVQQTIKEISNMEAETS